jgi:hypothetical protein
MITIQGYNVNEVWALFKTYMRNEDWVEANVRVVAPRGRTTMEIIAPVCSTYLNPVECALLDPVRDANPFFHVYEALWILAGRRDVKPLARYAKHIATYSDDGETFYGAYGYRMQKYNQLANVIDILSKDPDSRRAVIALYHPGDAFADTNDLPCNTTIFFKVRNDALIMTVCNRSNDAVWGAYGANAVHFSFLQQYIAGVLNVRVGPYNQISDSLHVYADKESGAVWDRCLAAPPVLLDSYSYHDMDIVTTPLIERGTGEGPFKFDLEHFMTEDGVPNLQYSYNTPFFRKVVVPMFTAYELHREGRTEVACHILRHSGTREAWVLAAYLWLMTRLEKKAAKEAA